VACPAGERAIGGGGRIRFDQGPTPSIAFLGSEPTESGWLARAHEMVPTNLAWTLRLVVVCARVAP
jgi:hypothetical protein